MQVDAVDFALRIWIMRDIDQQEYELRKLMICVPGAEIEAPMDRINPVGSFTLRHVFQPLPERYFAFEYLNPKP